MPVKQFGVRLKAEGGPETVSEVKKVETAIVHGADASAQANARAAAAAERLAAKYTAMAQAAQQTQRATAAQGQFNALLGVDRPAPSARLSAETFGMDDDQINKARLLKNLLDPLSAAQDRLNDELREYEGLARAGKISTDQLAQAQQLARTRFDETAGALDRQSKGMSRLAMASRLNLARQGADVAVTAAMGMNPGMIAIQQGPQILDAWATSAIKLTPAMLAAGAAVAVVGSAATAVVAGYLKGEASAIAYDRAVSGLGRTAGLTSSELRGLVEAGAEQGKVSISSAQSQAAAYLATGRIGRAVMVDLIAVGKDYAALMGMDAAAATDSLAAAMLAPDRAGRDLTRTMGLLDQKTLNHIDSLVKSGDLLAAQRILLDAVSDAANGHAEKVSGITSAWDAAANAISNAATRFGEWLYITDEEKAQGRTDAFARQIDSRNARISAIQSGAAGATFGGGMPGLAALSETGRAAAVERLRRENANDQQALDAVRFANLRETWTRNNATVVSSRNQTAQLAVDRQETPRRTRGGADETGTREAEAAAREAQARARREEDARAALDLEKARARGDIDQVRRIDDANAARMRTRQLIDDGTSAEDARTQVLREQAELIQARGIATARETDTLQRSALLEAERLRGNAPAVALEERRVNLAETTARYVEAGNASYVASVLAVADLVRVENARSEAMGRSVIAAERERQTRLANLRGDYVSARELDRQNRIDARAREIEGRENLNRGSADGRAASEIEEETRAALTGARRDWAYGLAQDIRQSGIKSALASQLDRAGDKLIENLVDGLMRVKWGDLINGKGSGSGGFLNGLVRVGASLFGGGNSAAANIKVGANAEGTSDWRGGLTWVGERGKELMNVPRGTEILSHGRSLDAVRSAMNGGSGVRVLQPVSFNLAGAVMTEDLMRQVNDLIERSRQKAVQEATAAAGPSSVDYMKRNHLMS